MQPWFHLCFPLQDTPVMQMSYDDPYSIIDLVKSAKCIINVAGPYMLTQGELMNLKRHI